MRKLIDIPDEIVNDLKIICKKENRHLKNFIENHLVKLVKNEKTTTVKSLKQKK